MKTLRQCAAPAKLNLFLQVIGRRPDGYHLLQSVFQLIDLQDTLDFVRRDDGAIVRLDAISGVQEDDDLVVRAARLLKAASKTHYGAEIALVKRIPMGGGLGGGSSDAATTLLALNRLWDCGFSRDALMRLGEQLGADVGFFLFGHNAFVEGIGEQMTAIDIAPSWFAVIHPGIAVPTPAIFTAPELTRNSEALKIADFSARADGRSLFVPDQAFGRNDLEPVAVARYPEVGRALQWLGRWGQARMSGSGACVYCPMESEARALESMQGLPQGWTGWASQGLSEHPLADWARG